MAKTDLALQAYARDAPDEIVSLLRRHVRLDLPDHHVEPLDFLDAHLVSPALVADWVVRVAEEILHVEWQGYRDAQFLDRLFRYHLLLAVRHPTRRVRTVALWLRRPSATERKSIVRRSEIVIRVHHVVVAELSARALLASGHAVFAAGAALDGLEEGRLCDEVVRQLVGEGRPDSRLAVAMVVAMTAGRYTAMRDAMQRAHVEPVIYLDLLEAGVDEGHRRGLAEGEAKGRVEGLAEGELHATRRILANLLRVRGFAPNAELERRIDEAPLDQLHRWIERVPAALLPADVFEGPTSPSP